jgi:hypothetical protein
MNDAVPIRAPTKFAELSIDWTQAARTEPERSLREAFLTYELSCGPNGLVSVLLLAMVSRRHGSIDEIEASADHAEVLLGAQAAQVPGRCAGRRSRLSQARRHGVVSRRARRDAEDGVISCCTAFANP